MLDTHLDDMKLHDSLLWSCLYTIVCYRLCINLNLKRIKLIWVNLSKNFFHQEVVVKFGVLFI